MLTNDDLATIKISSNTAVLLDRGASGQTLIRRDGTFTLFVSIFSYATHIPLIQSYYLDRSDVPAGEYILSFVDREWLFPEYAITVTPEDGVLAKPHRAGEVPSPHINNVPYPLVVRPTGSPVFKEHKKAFSLVNLVMGNPMYLLMAVGAVLVFAMPKLMVSSKQPGRKSDHLAD